MEKKIDLRVQKTRSALVLSLFELMRYKSLDEITVTEICEKAMIRKATFYKHFGDKTELLVYMIQKLQYNADGQAKICYDPTAPMDYFTDGFRYMMEFIDRNEELIANVLKSNSSSFVRNILEEQIRYQIDTLLKQAEQDDIRSSHAMLSAIYAGAIVSCAIWWLQQTDRPDKEEIILQFTKLMNRF